MFHHFGFSFSSFYVLILGHSMRMMKNHQSYINSIFLSKNGPKTVIDFFIRVKVFFWPRMASLWSLSEAKALKEAMRDQKSTIFSNIWKKNPVFWPFEGRRHFFYMTGFFEYDLKDNICNRGGEGEGIATPIFISTPTSIAMPTFIPMPTNF